MELTSEEAAKYEQIINDLVIQVTDPAKARDLLCEDIVSQMIPDHRSNLRIQTAIKFAAKANIVAFTWGDFKNALRKFTTQWHAKIRSMAHTDRLEAIFGVAPRNEREYVDAFMTMRQYTMNYHREFFAGHNKVQKKLDDILHDARLTAGDHNLIKPRGDLLSVTEIGVAMHAWCSQQREQCKQRAAERVRFRPDHYDATIDTGFHKICGFFFPEAERDFCEAACRKVVWSVKNRLLGTAIKQPHMIVLVGPQDGGKTQWGRMLYGPLEELTAEVSLQDVLDTRQMDMPEYFILFPDEMSFVERTEPAQLKTFLTGTTPSRRPMRTNISERIQINATLLGTANHSLDRLIYDSTGMRRFVEIRPRPRHEIEPFWDEIVKFDWLRFWQNVDPSDDDPLISKFRNELMVKQERIRNLDNCEMWLQSFVPTDHRDYRRHETSSAESWEFFAEPLYQIFRRWEDEFDPGFRGTSIQRWGREMRSLIDNGRIADWKYRSVGNKTAYSVICQTISAKNSVVPLKYPFKR